MLNSFRELVRWGCEAESEKWSYLCDASAEFLWIMWTIASVHNISEAIRVYRLDVWS